MDEGKRRELNRRYHAAGHGVQSAIAFMLENHPESAGASPKHLRVGLNMCLVDASAIAGLLIQKGVITEEEYYTAVAEAAEKELERQTRTARVASGIPNLTFS